MEYKNMKKLVTMCAVLCMAATAAQGAILYYTAHLTPYNNTTADVAPYLTFTGAYANSGGTLKAPGIEPTNAYQGFYISSNVPIVGVRYGTYSIDLPTAGWYDVFTTFGATTSAKPDVKHVVTDKNGSTDYFVDQTVAGGLVNTWVSLGTHAFNANDAANTKVKLTNDNQSTSGSLYFGALKFEASLPGAAMLTGPANGATDVALDVDLTWSGGSFTSFFDVFFSVDPDPAVFATDLAGGTSSLDLGTLAENTTYYWKVRAKNVDQTADSEIYSFTTLPEPAAVVLLALSSVLLVPRRRRA
ncbi:MAG: hypothetical protein QUV05_02245 [Phycisphaerae bacterium]|nr:hypothetical protein [Phycisphaerae bacterium]